MSGCLHDAPGACAWESFSGSACEDFGKCCCVPYCSYERGITIRKTIDTLIATRCIESDYALLYSDRDFDPFVAHLGPSSAMS